MCGDRKWGGGGHLFEAGRLLTFSAFRMGAYSRWALIRGWALIRINTVFTLTFMAVYRWRVIINSLQPEMRHRFVVIWIAGIWFVAVLLLLPLVVVAETNKIGSCMENWGPDQSRAYTVILFILQYVLPLLTIAGAYVLIAIEIGKAEKRHISNAQDRAALELRRKEDIQIIKMMGMIVILFAVCMLPIQVAWLISDFGPDEYKKVASVMLRMADIAAYLHACVNPIIFLLKPFMIGLKFSVDVS